MKSVKVFLWPPLLAIWFFATVQGDVGRMVCYYDSSSYLSEGTSQIQLKHLDPALRFCNYLVYGYVGINNETFELKSLNEVLDLQRDHFRTITALKRKEQHLRILLSVGGGRDPMATEVENNQYLRVLEEAGHRQKFVNSAVSWLRTYGFDGLDLAWQFPENPPKMVGNAFKKAWWSVKNFFGGNKFLDDNAANHREQFTALIRELNGAFRPHGYMLTLTMLPNINPALFVDAFPVTANVDFINLATIDFHTPERDPKVADYTAPLYAMYDRSPEANVDYHVQYWLNASAPGNLINVGIASYARAWQMTSKSGITGYPPVPETNGPAGTGILSWPEVCEKLLANRNSTNSIRKVGDPTRRYGSYAYRDAADDGSNGIWVSYEDPITAAVKAHYVTAKGLGGVALFDLTKDDVFGYCAGEKYTILRAIKYKL